MKHWSGNICDLVPPNWEKDSNTSETFFASIKGLRIFIRLIKPQLNDLLTQNRLKHSYLYSGRVWMGILKSTGKNRMELIWKEWRRLFWHMKWELPQQKNIWRIHNNNYFNRFSSFLDRYLPKLCRGEFMVRRSHLQHHKFKDKALHISP